MSSDPYAGIEMPTPPKGYRLARWGEECYVPCLKWMASVKEWQSIHEMRREWSMDAKSIFAVPCDNDVDFSGVVFTPEIGCTLNLKSTGDEPSWWKVLNQREAVLVGFNGWKSRPLVVHVPDIGYFCVKLENCIFAIPKPRVRIPLEVSDED